MRYCAKTCPLAASIRAVTPVRAAISVSGSTSPPRKLDTATTASEPSQSAQSLARMEANGLFKFKDRSFLS